MKLKMKTTATLLIAILMISAFAVAIPVMAITDYNYGFQTSLPGDSVNDLLKIRMNRVLGL